jgi:hypothetical protein
MKNLEELKAELRAMRDSVRHLEILKITHVGMSGEYGAGKYDGLSLALSLFDTSKSDAEIKPKDGTGSLAAEEFIREIEALDADGLSAEAVIESLNAAWLLKKSVETTKGDAEIKPKDPHAELEIRPLEGPWFGCFAVDWVQYEAEPAINETQSEPPMEVRSKLIADANSSRCRSATEIQEAIIALSGRKR